MKVRPSTLEIMQTNQTLVALAAEAQEISRLILESDGELSTELERRLDLNTTAIAAKVDKYVFIEDELEAKAALWKRRADACKAMHERFVKAQEQLRSRVKAVMLEAGKKELNGAYHRYVLSQLKPKVVIPDESILPNECKMIQTKMVPDKDKIKSLLEDGIEVPGAGLEQVYSLRTYENNEE